MRKKKNKRGLGKTIRVKPDEFKKMISEMESSAMKENQKCNTSCYKIKTNHAKDKKKLQLKRKCHQGCEKKRMKTVKAFHKKYPKEFKGFVKSLGGGGNKKSFKRRTVRQMKDGSYNQEDIDHNKKYEKDKSEIYQIHPKLAKTNIDNNIRNIQDKGGHNIGNYIRNRLDEDEEEDAGLNIVPGSIISEISKKGPVKKHYGIKNKNSKKGGGKKTKRKKSKKQYGIKK